MPLAEGMKTLVNDLKRQRKARRNAVIGNREIVRQITEENRAYLSQIHDRNRKAAEESRQMLKSSSDARKAEYQAMMDSIHTAIERVHQAKKAITDGARAAMQEFREDHKMAQSYWAAVNTEDLIVEEPTVIEPTATLEKPDQINSKKEKEKKDPGVLDNENPDSLQSELSKKTSTKTGNTTASKKIKDPAVETEEPQASPEETTKNEK